MTNEYVPTNSAYVIFEMTEIDGFTEIYRKMVTADNNGTPGFGGLRSTALDALIADFDLHAYADLSYTGFDPTSVNDPVTVTVRNKLNREVNVRIEFQTETVGVGVIIGTLGPYQNIPSNQH